MAHPEHCLGSNETDRHRFLDAEARRELLMRQWVENNLAQCPHTHTILATAWIDVEAGPDIKIDEQHPFSVTLYDWCCSGAETPRDDSSSTSPPSYVAPTLTTRLFEPHPHLASLVGFEDLGTMRIDADADLLAILAAATDEDQDENEYDFCDGDDSFRPKPPLAESVRQLRQRLQSGEFEVHAKRHRPLQLWSFSVRSDVEGNNIFTTSPDKALTWKWCKPDSPYHKNSQWFKELHEVLEHGSWNGGKNLTLLARLETEDPIHM